MKFQKREAFEKHFTSSFPEHLSAAYLFVCPIELERHALFKWVEERLSAFYDVKKEQPLKEALTHLNSPSLLFPKVAAFLDLTEIGASADLKSLVQYLNNPSPSGCLVLALPKGKSALDLYQAGKKEVVFLDLSAEKPWEQKQRLKNEGLERIAQMGKKMSPSALAAFFEKVPLERFTLMNELEKLFCFVGTREEITLRDVEEVASMGVERSIFQLADELVWKEIKQPSLSESLSEASFLLPLIVQLRSLLEIGLGMAALLEKGMKMAEIEARYPQIWKSKLPMYVEGCRLKGSSFFKRALIALFELELGVKRNLAAGEVLFTIFVGKII